MIYHADMDNFEEKKALLDWYIATGVDETIGEEPINRFAAAAPPQKVSLASNQGII